MAAMSAGIDESMVPDLNGWLVSTSACTGFLGTICTTHSFSTAHLVTICQASEQGKKPDLQHPPPEELALTPWTLQATLLERAAFSPNGSMQRLKHLAWCSGALFLQK